MPWLFFFFWSLTSLASLVGEEVRGREVIIDLLVYPEYVVVVCASHLPVLDENEREEYEPEYQHSHLEMTYLSYGVPKLS